MNILLIHQAFVTPEQGGGTRHYEFGRYCVRQGHEFTVVTGGVSYLTGRKAESVDDAEDAPRILRAKTLAVLHRGFVWRVLAFLFFMWTSFWTAIRAGRADVVMGTSPPIFQAFSAWLVAVFRRRPLLLEVRDLWPEFAVAMGVLRNRLLIGLGRRMERFLYRRAKLVLVNSPAYREYLIEKGVPEDKIRFIPNGVDPEMFPQRLEGPNVERSGASGPVEESALAEWGLAGKFVVAYAGALGLANDIPTVLEAAERLRGREDIHFLLIGDGKERPRLERMAEELGLSNVTFTGALSKSRTRDLLAASGACLAILQDIPMFRTTYPNKVFDYMATGKPTLLAIDGVIREVIEASGGGVFVPPGDPGALVEAVEGLASDPERAEAMGRAARRYVAEHFNRRDHAQQFLQLVREMV